jgi:hypothetical protein
VTDGLQGSPSTREAVSRTWRSVGHVARTMTRAGHGRESTVAVYTVTLLADTLEQVTALRGRKLDLHERAARRRPECGDYAVPAVLTDEQIAQLRSEEHEFGQQFVPPHSEMRKIMADVSAGLTELCRRAAGV